MKKIAVGILAAAITASTAITGMAGYGTGQKNLGTGNDGNCATGTVCLNDQVITWNVLRQTTGRNYVDSDKDGICDNYDGGKQATAVNQGSNLSGNGNNQVNVQEENNNGSVVNTVYSGQENNAAQAATTGKNYVDSDGDGVCDNYDGTNCNGTGGAGKNQGNNGAGGNGACVGGTVCPNKNVTADTGTGQTATTGKNYVDSNGDGVCDNYDGANCNGTGQGQGSGNGAGYRGGRNR